MISKMEVKRMITNEIAKRYQKASKKEKGKILTDFISITHYNRNYASWILRNCGRKLLIKKGGKTVAVIVGEIKKEKITRPRARIYDDEVAKVLKRIWMVMDLACGKRLRPFMQELLEVLERNGELKIMKHLKNKLLNISASTIDRLLKPERHKIEVHLKYSKRGTKPGTLLKKQIPIKTFSDWDKTKPGFMEIDLVGHDGGNIYGDFIYTLDATDIATSWTETRAVQNKAQVWVFEALCDIEKSIPFPLLGIDSDNGTEFINAHLFQYCKQKNITFTRSRAYKKNDCCFVEQKNWSIVRRSVGYARYDTKEELNILNELYGYLRLYTNFFQPTMKLVEKIRIGSKVKKIYDTPKTPYKRVIESTLIPVGTKLKLKRQYDTLNPVEIKRNITRLQNKLLKITEIKRPHTSSKMKTDENISTPNSPDFQRLSEIDPYPIPKNTPLSLNHFHVDSYMRQRI